MINSYEKSFSIERKFRSAWGERCNSRIWVAQPVQPSLLKGLNYRNNMPYKPE